MARKPFTKYYPEEKKMKEVQDNPRTYQYHPTAEGGKCATCDLPSTTKYCFLPNGLLYFVFLYVLHNRTMNVFEITRKQEAA